MRLLTMLFLLSGPILAEPPHVEAGALAEGIQRFHAQDLETAEALLFAIQKTQPEDAEVNFYLGRVYLAQGLSQAAVEALERSARLDPENTAYQFWLAEALVARIGEVAVLFKLGVANRMRAAYEKAVELDPENLAARVAVARYHAQAPMIAGGNPAMVTQQLDEIRRRDPALAHIAQGLIHEQLGRPDSATAEFEIAVQVDSESVASWREAGLFHQRRQHWQDAQRAFEEVLVRQPDDSVALFEAARTALTLSERQLARAERALQAYLGLEPGPDPIVLSEGETPSYSVAHQRLALVYERQGRLDLARELKQAPQAKRIDFPLVDAAQVD